MDNRRAPHCPATSPASVAAEMASSRLDADITRGACQSAVGGSTLTLHGASAGVARQAAAAGAGGAGLEAGPALAAATDGATPAMGSPRLSRSATVQPSGTAAWRKRSSTSFASISVSSARSRRPSAGTGTAIATSHVFAIGPKKTSPTAGWPVESASGTAARPCGRGNAGSSVP